MFDDLLVVQELESPVVAMHPLVTLALGRNVGTVARLTMREGATLVIARLWVPGEAVGVFEAGFRRVEILPDTPEGIERGESTLRTWFAELVAAHSRAITGLPVAQS